jgi:hypothetical protein
MHVLHRPQLPRVITVSIVAATVAVVISVALLAGVKSIVEPGNSGTSVRAAAPAVASAARAGTPRWAASPFASLTGRPPAQPWLSPRP